MSRQRHLFVMDPIESVLVDKDSTFALMLEAQRRGHEVLYTLVSDLYTRQGRAYCLGRSAKVKSVQGKHAVLGELSPIDLGQTDVVWMRKDPPFNMDYIFNTYVLDLAETSGRTLVVNGPEGLRSMNEKAWAMRFEELVPASLISQDMSQIRAFVDELGHAVVKPLDGNGGEGVFVVRDDDPNIGVIIEKSTQHGRIKVLTQRYLPEAKHGDKRIILVDGEPVGGILRVPQGVDHRGNIHVGASVIKGDLTPRDREICRQLAPHLTAERQIFVGIDVIGGYLTEVNVTSPTGIHEIDAYYELSVAGLLLDAVDRRLAER